MSCEWTSSSFFAHPQRDSFCGAVLERVLSSVEEGGGTVRLRDLYQAGFDPRLSPAEFERERRRGCRGSVSSDVHAEQEHVRWADAVVFICPLWWSDVPAILKGWFDRTWTKGFAWTYEDEAELRSVAPRRAVLLITAGASSEKLAEDGTVQALEAVGVGDRLRNVGFAAVELVILGGLDSADQTEIQRLLERAGGVGASIMTDVA